MYLKAGEILTVQELLYGLMLCSGNDAAVALAIYCGGTVEGFAELMNDKARSLGLADTHFVNPNGLDAPGHYSTARDLAVLAAYAMSDPIFAQTVSTRQVKLGERYLTNHNKLLWQVEGADGVKTGYTKAAGRILVSSATRDGRRLICVTINAPSDWSDHAKLLEQGFQDYEMKQIVTAGQTLGNLEVVCGQESEVKLVAESGFSYPLSAGEEPEIVMPETGFVYAPVNAGAKAGVAYVMLGDETIGKITLLFGSDVDQAQEEKKSLWDKLFGGN